MGHIASELTRAYNFDQQNDFKLRNQSLIRALELIDLTLADKRWRFGVTEIARFRELVADWFSGLKIYDVPSKQLIDYCMVFALHERRNL